MRFISSIAHQNIQWHRWNYLFMHYFPTVLNFTINSKQQFPMPGQTLHWFPWSSVLVCLENYFPIQLCIYCRIKTYLSVTCLQVLKIPVTSPFFKLFPIGVSSSSIKFQPDYIVDNLGLQMNKYFWSRN